jgi:hypothetical protein
MGPAFMRSIVLMATALLLLARPAFAQGPIATAPTGGPAAPQPTSPSVPLPTTAEFAAEPPPLAMGPCGPEKVKSDGTLETKPHGELEASIGTGGYRQFAGAVCQPLGQNGYVAISAGETQFDGTHRRH